MKPKEKALEKVKEGKQDEAISIVKHTIEKGQLEKKEYYELSLFLAEIYQTFSMTDKAKPLVRDILNTINEDEFTAQAIKARNLMINLFEAYSDKEQLLLETVNRYDHLFDTTSDDEILAALGNLYETKGKTISTQGKYEEAISDLTKSLEIYQALNDIGKQSKTCYNLGSLYTNIEDYEHAELLLGEALKLQQQLDNTYGVGYTMMALGSIYLKQDRIQEAKNAFDKQYQIFMEYGGDEQKAWAYTDQGNCLLAMGKPQEALELFNKALPLYKKGENNEITLANQYTYFSSAYQELGNLQKALGYDKKALGLYKLKNHETKLAKTYLSKAKKHITMGDDQEALDSLTNAFNIYQSSKNGILRREIEEFKEFIASQQLDDEKISGIVNTITTID